MGLRPFPRVFFVKGLIRIKVGGTPNLIWDRGLFGP
uniref:Uncharacterized protein n=1 Tax=Schistosoma japonicum TaxID=6182 RepID=Q5BR39_SCHJA|nr:unknown [Schistosoma japonicum]